MAFAHMSWVQQDSVMYTARSVLQGWPKFCWNGKPGQVSALHGCIVQKHILFRVHRVEGENFASEDFCHFIASCTSTLIALYDGSSFSVNGITRWSCHLSTTASITEKSCGLMCWCHATCLCLPRKKTYFSILIFPFSWYIDFISVPKHPSLLYRYTVT